MSWCSTVYPAKNLIQSPECVTELQTHGHLLKMTSWTRTALTRKAVWKKLQRSTVQLEESLKRKIVNDDWREERQNCKSLFWSGDTKLEIFGLHAYYVEQKAAKNPHNKWKRTLVYYILEEIMLESANQKRHGSPSSRIKMLEYTCGLDWV